MRSVGILLAALVTLALTSPAALRAQGGNPPPAFPEMNHLPSGQPEAYTHMRTGLSFIKKAEKARQKGRTEDEKNYLEGAQFHLRQVLQAQESLTARLALGEVENLLGNPKEGWAQCRQALALKEAEEKDRQRAAACVKAAVRLDPSLEPSPSGT
jgi:plasmid maintenance system antidote protein VapI